MEKKTEKKTEKKATDEETKGLELLLQRPLEPVFTSRDNGKTSFQLPDTYYIDEYKGVEIELESRFGDDVDTKIPLREIPPPDLRFAQGLGKKKQFCLFYDHHQEIASRLIKIFMDAPDVSHFMSLCAYTKDRVNPVLFQYCYSVALQHRPDTKHVKITPIFEQFPQGFVEPSVFKDARAEGSLIRNSGTRTRIEIEPNFTASDREQEQRLAYFREDIGVNSHHWHWHLVYPTQGPLEVVNKDRRGELFYYMHHQILARYNVERFCNHLAQVKPLNNLREPIPEGYFPKILSSVNNRTYPSRATNVSLKDINRDQNNIEISEVERWADRVHQAIDKGYIETLNGNIPLDPIRGIDILGNIIESSALSPNRQLYGNLHNMGHNLISLSHDPDARHLEEFGVMGDVSTAMRDPVFYRWHGYIDAIFSKYKSLLPAYNEQELSCTGVKVDDVSIIIVSGKKSQPNFLLSYWEKSDVDLAAGLDFGPNGNIYAHFTHLQHAPFMYTITATNDGDELKTGTCRIFLIPKVDERNTPLKYNEQRNMAIELDKFTVKLNPGQNIIKRYSDESSVTIPYERSYRKLGQQFQPTDNKELASFQFCGCGWPQHLLMPKGTDAGMAFDLYVMISDYTDDAVQQDPSTQSVCGDSYSFCGLKDKLYPDKRAMGFPFDRRGDAETLSQFCENYPNMKSQDITIKFNNIVVDKK